MTPLQKKTRTPNWGTHTCVAIIVKNKIFGGFGKWSLDYLWSKPYFVKVLPPQHSDGDLLLLGHLDAEVVGALVLVIHLTCNTIQTIKTLTSQNTNKIYKANIKAHFSQQYLLSKGRASGQAGRVARRRAPGTPPVLSSRGSPSGPPPAAVFPSAFGSRLGSSPFPSLWRTLWKEKFTTQDSKVLIFSFVYLVFLEVNLKMSRCYWLHLKEQPIL